MLRKIGASLLSPILLILAFPDPQISIFAWIALIPLFFVIGNSSKKASFFLSYLAGAVFFAGLLRWLTHVTVPGYAVLVSYLALYFGLFGLLGNLFLNKLRGSGLYFLSILILPSLWVSLEFLRGVLFTGFPWGLLGYTQYKNPVLIQIADITGAYGVSFLIVMANFAVYSWIASYKESRGSRFQALAFLIVFITVILYGCFVLKKDSIETGLKLSVVQGNIEQAKKWDPFYKDYIMDRYEGLTREAAKDEPGLIIWPETSVPGFLGEKDIGLRLKRIIVDIDLPLFLGAATYGTGPGRRDVFFNSAALFSPDGNMEKVYNKIHLVPFGEYVPFEKYFPLIRDFIDVPVGDYTAGEEFTLFDVRSKEGDNFNYAALICFEDIFPGLVRSFALRGCDFLINITNDAWFGESGEQLQHAQASVFRAVENRVSVLRAANTGFSCYINPKGMIEGSVGDIETGSMYIPGFKTFVLKAAGKGTFYTRYGDVFAYICLFLVIGAGALRFFS